MRVRSTVAAVIFGGSAISATASATLINIDFNGANNSPGGPTATGAAVVGAPGDTWNGLPGTPGGPTALNNSAGGATAVTVTWSSSGSWDGGGSPSPNPALTQDYLYQFGPGGTTDLSGLTPFGTYTLYLYTQNNDDNNRQTDFSVVGFNTATAQSGVGSQGLAAWVQGVNYSKVTVAANGLGQINIDFASDPGHTPEAELNGLQIIPEPASLGLLSLGAVSLLARRRRA